MSNESSEQPTWGIKMINNINDTSLSCHLSLSEFKRNLLHHSEYVMIHQASDCPDSVGPHTRTAHAQLPSIFLSIRMRAIE